MAADSGERLFQRLELPQQWADAASARFGPCVWGAGDMTSSRLPLPPDALRARVLTGGTRECEMAICAAANDAGCVRYAFLAHATAPLRWTAVAAADRARLSEHFRASGASEPPPVLPFEGSAQQQQMQFPLHTFEQHEGDLLVVPPECVCSAVTTRGGHADVVNWYRHCPESLELALSTLLPACRRECVTPAVNVKQLILDAAAARVEAVEHGALFCGGSDPPTRDLQTLLRLVATLLNSEWVELFEMQKHRSCSEVVAQLLETEIPSTCSNCKAHILNRCFRCPECERLSSSRTYFCLDCVMEGRTCDHLKSFALVNSVRMSTSRAFLHRVLQAYNRTAGGAGFGEAIINGLAKDEVSPATVAFNLVTLAFEDFRATCHQCKLAKPRHLMVFCACHPAESPKKTRVCTKKYCVSCLWNRYMLKQWECLRKKNWCCPFCSGTCNCSACLRKRGIDPNTYDLPFVVPSPTEYGVRAPEGTPAAAATTSRAPRPRLRRKLKEGQTSQNVVFLPIRTIPAVPALQQQQQLPLSARSAHSPIVVPLRPSSSAAAPNAGGSANSSPRFFFPGKGPEVAVAAAAADHLLSSPPAEEPLLSPQVKRARVESGLDATAIAFVVPTTTERKTTRFWARLGPYSLDYPARSLTEEELTSLGRRSFDDGTVPLFFFGDRMIAFVRRCDIRPWDAEACPPEFPLDAWQRAMRDVAASSSQ